MEIRDTPLAVAEGFAAAWNDYDAEALAGLFVEDAEFVNVVGLWWHDREHIRQAHDYGFRKIFRNSHMKLGRTAVRDLGADVARSEERRVGKECRCGRARAQITGNRGEWL